MTPPTDKAPRSNHWTRCPQKAVEQVSRGEVIGINETGVQRLALDLVGARSELRRLTARVQVLERALREYSKHRRPCNGVVNGIDGDCQCGLNAALAGGGEKEG